jgi:hypothetical protein
MRAQYHFRDSPQGLCAWSVHRLVELPSALPHELVPLSAIRELDEPYWADERNQKLACRAIVDHARLMLECDLVFPIILFSDGRVMDGMQRVCKALLQGIDQIEAVRFLRDPEPGCIGACPDDLPYRD